MSQLLSDSVADITTVFAVPHNSILYFMLRYVILCVCVYMSCEAAWSMW